MNPINISASSTTTASKPARQNGKMAWPEALSSKQNFSLPDGIIYYIARNPPSPDFYLTLASSCKYFFEKHSVLVAKRYYDDEKKLCSSDDVVEDGRCCVSVDLAKTRSKLWILNDVFLSNPYGPNQVSTLLPKIYRSEADTTILALMRIEISMKELKCWASKFENFDFDRVKINDEDESTVMVDKILESLPNVYIFRYAFNLNAADASPSIMKNIVKLQNLGNLRYFRLADIPEMIPVEDISAFITKHSDISFLFDFRNDISDQYKIQLDALVNLVIESGVRDRLIFYRGQDKTKLETMQSQFDIEDELFGL